jgi:hypothetical protein
MSDNSPEHTAMPHYQLVGTEILKDCIPVIKFYAGSAIPYRSWKEKANLILQMLNAEQATEKRWGDHADRMDGGIT